MAFGDTIAATVLGKPSTPQDTDATANAVAEGAAVNTYVGITAHSTFANGDASVDYSLTADSSGGGFKIDQSTGMVTVADPSKIDFESSPGHTYTITVMATKNGNFSSQQTFTIGVNDVAPSTPVDSNPAANTVLEGAAAGTTVGITASASDVNGGAITWSLTGDTSGGGFTINPTTGVITVADGSKIDYESSAGHAYTVTATASDGTLTHSQTFTINVGDVAMTTPVDSNGAANTVAEGASAGTTVGITAQASDPSGPATTYSLIGDTSGGGFTINSSTGVVTVADPSKIDFESTAPGHTYSITVQASNGAQTTSQSFSIGVTDVAPSAPTDTNAAANSVAEGAAVGTVVGVTAHSTDVNGGAVTYSLIGDSSGGGFTINSSTGVITVANPAKIDYETAPGHAYTVTAQASDGTLTSSQTFSIGVTDVAPLAPTDTDGATNTVAEGAAVGTAVGITAHSTDVNGPGVTYSLTGDSSGGGFTINASTGVITVADSTKIDYETTGPGHTYSVTATASDGTLTNSQAFTINVTDVAPSTPTDTNGAANNIAEGATNGSTVGVTASAADPNGPSASYILTDNAGGRFAINSSTGVVTVANGAAIDFETAPGAGHTYSITVQATSGALSSSQSFSIGVADVAPSTPNDTDGGTNHVGEGMANGSTVGITAFSSDPGGGPAATYVLSNDAGGRFTINSTTGVVTVANGAAIDYETAPGHAYGITVQATAGALSSTQNFTIDVDNANEAPVNSVPGGQTVNEDTALVFSTANGNAISISDVDAFGGDETVTLTVSSGTLALGSTANLTTFTNNAASITLTGTLAHINTALNGLTYQGNLNFNGGDTLTMVSNDNGNSGSGSPLSDTDTVGITVSPVDDAPVVTAGHTLNYTENQVATAIDTALTVTDVDNANLASATVQISAGYVNGEDVLAFTNTATITGSFNAATGTMTLTGSDTVANYQAALRSVTYVNTSDNPSGADRTVTITANDGALNSTAATDTIHVTPVNDAPVVTAGHTLNYTENQSPTAIDPAIGVSDVDSANLASATVQISGNYVPGEDQLGFTDTATITSSFNSATGTLTLTGTDTVAHYQAALASVMYFNTSDNPSGLARTVTIVTNDGALDSSPVTDTINVTPVNDAPVAVAGHTLSYTENDPATAIDTAFTVTDVDSANLTSATVQISANYVNGQDLLGFTNTATITGSFNAATGTLTLTGSDSVANYQAALRSVTYSNSSEDPSAASRTVTIITNDGAASSGAVTDTITVQPVNDGPTLTATGNNPNYNPGGVDLFSTVAASTIEAGQKLDQLKLTVSHISGTSADSLTVDGTSVALTNGNVVSTSTPGVTATVAVSGSDATVTIDSSSGLTNSEMAALVDGLSYTDTAPVNPGDPARVVTITLLHDTGGTSPGVDTTVLNITSTVFFDQAPVVTAGNTLNYTENQGATAIDTALTVTDTDSPNLTSAKVQITGGYVNGEDVLAFANTATITGSFNASTGTMTLTGSDTVANYQAALRSVTYVNTSENPSGADRTVTITANDGLVDSTAVTDTIHVTPVNDAPVITAGHTLNYTEDQAATAIDPAITVVDVDNANLASATVQISTNYVSGEDVLAFSNTATITGSFNAGNGMLTLTGSDSVANYQAALASVTYVNTSQNPSGLARTVTFIANDGTANSVAKTDTINVTPVNDAPVTTAGGTLNYTENQGATVIDASVTVTDVDNANMNSATVAITGGFASGQDVLSADTAGTSITASYSAATGVLTLSNSDTKAHYQQVLDSVTYLNSSDNPSGADRTVSYTVNDGALNSNTSTATVHVTPVNDAPVVTATGTLAYTEDQGPAAIAPALTVTDADSGTLAFATVQISANYVNGEDVLAFANTANITGSFNAASGTMTLTGTDTVANYQTAMRAVTYVDNSQNPSTSARTVTFTADDGQGANHLSAGSDHSITVASVNDAPINNGVPSSFIVESGFSHAVTGLSITDVDAGAANDITTTFTAAAGTVSIGNGASGGTAGIAGGATVTTNASGTVVLTGTVTQINASLAGNNVVYNAADSAANTSSTTTLQMATNDHGHTGTPGAITDTDTINIGVIPQVWFINGDQTGADATATRGSQTNPFSTISEFNASSGPGTNDYIYVKAGTYNGDGINLKDGQILLGDDQALSFADPLGGPTIVIETASGVRPTINVTTAGDQAIDLGIGNTIHGINITTAAGTTGLDDGQGAGGNAVGSLTVDQMQISGAGQAVDIDQGGALAVSLESVSSTGGAEGIQLAGTASSGAGLLSGTFTAGTGSFAATSAVSGSSTAGIMVGDGGTTASAGGTVAITYGGTVTTTGTSHAIDIQDRAASAGNVSLSGTISHASGNGSTIFLDQNAAGTVTFSGANSVANSGTADAVHITNNGATVNFTGGGLNIDATTGTGFLASGGGTVSVTGSSNTIDTTSGTALNLANVTVGAGGINFASATTTSAATGISIDTVTGGAITVSGGSIAGATTRGVDINAASDNISIASTIGSTGGHSVEITNSGKSGGSTISFTGGITDTGGGINLDNNDQGGVATINFSGGLAINTSASNSNGFVATNGGTVNITQNNTSIVNTINSGQGTALDIANTNIGANDVTFRSISSSGGSANGIILDTTGSAGGLHVVGNGNAAAHDGGTIANKTGADASTTQGTGIYLNNTSEVQLTNMNLHDFQNFGIFGNTVNNFDLVNSTVNATASGTATNGTQQGSPNNESSMLFKELTGTANITNDTIADGKTTDLAVFNNTSGSTLTLNVSGSSFTGRDDVGLLATVQEILLVAGTNVGDSPTITANFTNNTITNNDARDIQAVANGAATMNINIGQNGVPNSGGTFGGMPAAMVDLDHNSTGAYNFNIQNATFTEGSFNGSNGASVPINIFNGTGSGSATVFQGRIVHNSITGQNNSGFDGIFLNNSGPGNMTVLVDSNSVTNVASRGIGYGGAQNADTNTANLTITNNTITMPDPNSSFGIQVSAMASSGTGSGTVNLTLTGNNVVNDTASPDYRVDALKTGATINMPGYVGGSQDTTAVKAFVAANNKTNGATSTSSEVSASVGLGNLGHFGNAASTPLPTNPQPLLAADGGVQASSPTAGETHLTQAELDAVVAAAISQWAVAGASAAQLAALHATVFSVADLAGVTVGEETNGHITIDLNAAGHGWFIDPTPNDNSEFTHAANAAGTDLYTDPSNTAAGHLDLLTTVSHELGHVIGLDDSAAASHANDLMYLYLVDGERRLPDATDVAQANAPGALQAEAALPLYAQAPAGTPVVAGTAANDTIDAGHGGNVLFGGAGADKFVFGTATPLDAPTPAQVTHVADYHAAEGDSFDFSAITSAFHGSSVSDALVVRAVEDASGKFATLQVDHLDPMALPSAPNWVNVAQLDGAHAGDSVNVLIDTQSLHLAHIHVDLLV